MHKYAYVCKGLLVKYVLKSYFVVLTLKYDYKNTSNTLFQNTSYLKKRVRFCRIWLAKGQIRPCLPDCTPKQIVWADLQREVSNLFVSNKETLYHWINGCIIKAIWWQNSKKNHTNLPRARFKLRMWWLGGRAVVW